MGRHPVYVENIQLVLRSGKKLPYRDMRGFDLHRPVEVAEGRPRELLFAIYTYMGEIKEPSQIKRIEVTDTRGTLYRYPGRIRSRKSFQRQIESEWTEERQEYWSQQLQDEDENRS